MSLPILIYVNSGLAAISFLACIAYFVKHHNSFRGIYLWKIFVTGYVAVLYAVIALGHYQSVELIDEYRVAWTLQLMIPIAMTIALWGYGNNGK